MSRIFTKIFEFEIFARSRIPSDWNVTVVVGNVLPSSLHWIVLTSNASWKEYFWSFDIFFFFHVNINMVKETIWNNPVWFWVTQPSIRADLPIKAEFGQIGWVGCWVTQKDTRVSHFNLSTHFHEWKINKDIRNNPFRDI